MSDYSNLQRHIARVALEASASEDFALAGSGAIREHGLIDRPTEDVDLFTIQKSAPKFEAAVDNVVTALRAEGFEVIEVRRMVGFAQLHVNSVDSSIATDIDMGIDWRALAPVHLEIGPVLDEHDAVGNKVAALFSRGEARDFLDVDAIRRNGPYSDRELIDLARNADPGFDLPIFIDALRRVNLITIEEVVSYGVSDAALDAIKIRLLAFADDLDTW